MTLDQNQVRKVFLEGLRFCKWLLYSGATGLLVGAVAAAFHLGMKIRKVFKGIRGNAV